MPHIAQKTRRKHTETSRSLAALIKSTFRSMHISREIERYSAFPFWSDIVGEELAKNAVPIGISHHRTMLVRVPDSVWAQELSLKKPDLLDKLHKVETLRYIEDIRFVTEAPRKPEHS